METESRASIMQRRKNSARQVISQLFFAGLFVLSVMLHSRILSGEPSISAKVAATGLPILAITLWAWWLSSSIRKLEEFERAVAVNSFAITFAILLWAITCYEFIAPIWGLPALPMFLLAPIAVILWHMSWEFLKHRYI